MTQHKKMGYEGKFYWGSPGSTADTETTLVRDVTITIDPTLADVSDRGSIMDVQDVAGLAVSLEVEVNNKPNDAFVAALITAAASGGAMAFRTEDKDGGSGFDGDCVVSFSNPQPLRDAQRITFTATPTDKEGRYPTFA